MNKKPKSPTKGEILEIASIKTFQKHCKATSAEDVVKIINNRKTIKWKLDKDQVLAPGDVFVIQPYKPGQRDPAHTFMRKQDGRIEELKMIQLSDGTSMVEMG